ncbi:MAG: EamA family transporter [Lentisphaerae bacterium]|nr:EamA family transporter [Lentisphaerota bacterium]
MSWKILIGVTILCWGAYSIMLKYVADRMAWQVSLLAFVLSYSVIVAAFSLWQMKGQSLEILTPALAWPLLAGGLCGLGGITYFKALPLAPGGLIMPLMGLFIPVAALGCILLFHERLGVREVIGLLCGVASIVLLAR